MATNNAINLNATGIVSYNGSGVFAGRTLTAGSGISISNGNGVAGNPTISNTAVGFAWVSNAVDVDPVLASTGYANLNPAATVLTYTLPVTPALGFTMSVQGVLASNAGSSWSIAVAPLTAQSIFLNNSSGITVTSTLPTDGCDVVCVDNTTPGSEVWAVRAPVGNLTIA